MVKICYYEGRFCSEKDVAIPISDYIIQRGVGVFDLVRTYGRRPMQMSAHLKRLLASASELGIEASWKPEQLAELVMKGIERCEGEVLAKIFITGGDDFVGECRFVHPRLFLTFESIALPPDEVYKKGVRLYLVMHGRATPTAKSVDYLSSYEKDKNDPEAFEVVYCPGGEITEAAHSTFFLVKKGKVVTAPSDRVLAGTTRAILLQLMEENHVDVELRCPRLDELPSADEAFIAGSLKQIVPVVEIGPQKIGTAVPGAFTERITKLFKDNIYRWVES